MIAADPLQRAASGRTESATFDSSREPRIGSKQCYSPPNYEFLSEETSDSKVRIGACALSIPTMVLLRRDVPNWKTGARRPVEASAFEPLGTWQSVNT